VELLEAYSTAPDNCRFLGPIGLKDLMKDHLLIRQGNTIAAIVFPPEDPLVQDYKYSGIEFKIVPPQ